MLLFLFPLVEKELHAFEHADDFHCTATDKHFHEQEHSCEICDYTLNDTYSTIQCDFQFILDVQSLEFYSSLENVYIPTAFSDLPSRAPPVA
jgi:hypothetical protein